MWGNARTTSLQRGLYRGKQRNWPDAISHVSVSSDSKSKPAGSLKSLIWRFNKKTTCTNRIIRNTPSHERIMIGNRIWLGGVQGDACARVFITKTKALRTTLEKIKRNGDEPDHLLQLRIRLPLCAWNEARIYVSSGRRALKRKDVKNWPKKCRQRQVKITNVNKRINWAANLKRTGP